MLFNTNMKNFILINSNMIKYNIFGVKMSKILFWIIHTNSAQSKNQIKV